MLERHSLKEEMALRCVLEYVKERGRICYRLVSSMVTVMSGANM